MSGFKTYTLGRTSPLMALLAFALIIMFLYWLAKGVFTLLAWAFPVMIIVTAIINYKVILGFGRWIWDSFKRNPIMGLGLTAFSVIAHPFVGLYLLFRAISSKSDTTKTFKALKGDFIAYEEVEDDFLDLSEIKKSKKNIDDKYNDLF